MENENQNQNNAPSQTEALQAYVAEQKGKRNKFILGGLVAVLVVIFGFFGLKNADLFRAAITPDLADLPAGDHAFYIPDYDASVGDEGVITLRTRQEVQDVRSIQFTLHYQPANALVFNGDSLVFDGEFPSADLQNVNTGVPGQVTVSFFSNTERDLPAESDVVSLQVQIDPDVPAGTEIPMTIDNVDVIVSDTAAVGGIASSTDPALTAMDAGSITLVTQNNLRLLYAESLTNTQVLLHFSDFLVETGVVDDYNITPFDLEITNVERGDAQGYAQDTVLLTTAPQPAGIGHEVALTAGDVGGTILSNSEGGVNEHYNEAPFFSPGFPDTSLSNFGVESAEATGEHTVVVTFTDNVSMASVTEDNFTEANDFLNFTNAVTAGSTVTLTVTEPLRSRESYLLTVDNTVQREGDGVALGFNQVAFRGFTNGPRVTGVSVAEDVATITFDSNITAGPMGALGTIHTTGLTDAVFPIIETGAGVTLSDNTIVVTGLATDPDVNYTFVANTGVSANGVPVDSAYNAVTFWGEGHDAATNTVGAVTVAKRNIIEIQPGTGAGAINFATLQAEDLDLFFYTSPTAIPSVVPVDSVTVDSGKLRIRTTADLVLNNHYILNFSDDDDTVLQSVDLAFVHDFEVTGAQATGAREVIVDFSENVDQSTVLPASFTIAPAGLTVTTANAVPGDYKKVSLVLDEPLAGGTVYSVTVDDVRSFNGGKPLMLDTAVFAGYQTTSDLSTVRVNRVESLSSTQMKVRFSGAVNAASVTPVNVSFFEYDNDTELTVMSVIQDPDDPTIFIFTTSAQVSDANYFFTAVDYPDLTRGVRDNASTGLILDNRRILNAFGFFVPQAAVSGFTPTSVTNDAEHVIVAAGRNLNLVNTVRVGTANAVITDKPANGLSLSFNIPAQFAAGVYSVTFVGADGTSRTYANALAVSEPETPLRIISESSLATPFRVPNDGETATTIRVLVEDPVDLDNVQSVTIDLTLIGGAPAQAMTKATGPQPANRQWYTFQTTVPATIATGSTPLELPVEARKVDGTTAVGVAKVHVTADQYRSVAPVIDQAFFTPMSVVPDGTTPVKLFAQVSDQDGADTIGSVVANLGQLGVGFLPLNEVTGVGSAAETVSRFYESAVFTIPNTTRVGDYQVVLTVQDATGETSTLTIPFAVSSDLSGPALDAAQSYVAPRNSVPRDGTTPFSLNVFVTDPDGVDDIVNVLANFGSLGLPPVVLTKDPSVPAAAKSAYYTATGLTIPSTTSTGVRQVNVTATDSSGSVANLVLQIDVTSRDTLGDSPRILTDRAYTTPRVAVNDGITPITLHVFVRDDDDDIDSVLVNLSSVGQVGSEHPDEFALHGSASSSSGTPSSSDGVCANTSPTLACLQPSVKEGSDGQWFILSNITVRSDLRASNQPYMIEVIATDQSGKTTRQTLPIVVSDGQSLSETTAPPEIIMAVATSETTVEAVFNKTLDASRLSADGREFSITSRTDVSDTLPLVGSTISADGNVVTLTTEAQQENKDYVINATSDVRDVTGTALTVGPTSRANFTGFSFNDRPPVVEYIAASASDTIEIEFRGDLRPSTVSAEDITIQESGGTSAELKVLGVRFAGSATALEVKTELQKSGQHYRVSIRDIATTSGITPRVTISKLIKGFKGSAAAQAVLQRSADLNGDGKVDFTDFTMFSAVYGTTLLNSQTNSNDTNSRSSGNGQPLTPEPDSTLPASSPIDL